MRAIDADALEKLLSDAEMEATKRKKYVLAGAINVIQGNVRNFPTIEPERKKGKWVDYSDEGYIECPFCHCIVLQDGDKDELHYCFSCGAELR